MTEIIGAYGGYRTTLSFGFACLIYHATEVFCSRNFSYKNDALGKTVGQMVGAARSARQNIVEGSARAGTSKETELRLYDVAKGSLEELAGDYEAFLIDRREVPWAEDDAKASAIMSLALDRYTGSFDRHSYGEYILAMRKRFEPHLEAEDPIVAANAILLAIDQACKLLHRQLTSVGATFREEGGVPNGSARPVSKRVTANSPQQMCPSARAVASRCERGLPTRGVTQAIPSGVAPDIPIARARETSWGDPHQVSCLMSPARSRVSCLMSARRFPLRLWRVQRAGGARGEGKTRDQRPETWRDIETARH